RPKLGPFLGIINQILEDDQAVPKKQRHTAKRIFERLRQEHGYQGGLTVVKDYVRERRRLTREMFVPLYHPPGDGQADFGEALAIIAGARCKAHYFSLALPHSDDMFVAAFPAETSEALCHGHNLAFAHFGGVPCNIVYDNTALAVAGIARDGTRSLTKKFEELASHYLFTPRFGRVGKGNDKGKVEGQVGYARRNFMVPIPRFPSFDAFNEWLLARCLERRDRRLRGHQESIGERFERDREAFLPLPPTPYDAFSEASTSVSSTSLVRFKTNDYSVPVEYGFREVLVKGYVDQVVVVCGNEEIARHPRSYEKHDLIFEPLHYLPLLERKAGALDQAAPLQGWELPDEFGRLRRLLENRSGKKGKREYIQVLRLIETFDLSLVAAGVRQTLELGAISFDAVKHLVLCRMERKPPRLDLENYPHLPRARVATTSAKSYMELLPGGGA
ncbi:MAG: IS21 family transposase, partial [Desulfarculaceae bacterium]|nr:IS21 family transposase [Desulfarculaceae bacterium]